jgi:transcriptional regulator with XRE-family HTH domain
MFYEKLRELRKQNNYSQEELANLLDISRQSVSKWESGISMPDLENVIKISDLFGVSIDYLLKDRKSDSDFNYYTVHNEKPLQIDYIAYVTIILSVITIVSLLILSFIIPHNYSDLSRGIDVTGFMAYYYSFLEFRITVLTAAIATLLAISIIIIPDDLLRRIFVKKSSKNK